MEDKEKTDVQDVVQLNDNVQLAHDNLVKIVASTKMILQDHVQLQNDLNLIKSELLKGV